MMVTITVTLLFVVCDGENSGHTQYNGGNPTESKGPTQNKPPRLSKPPTETVPSFPLLFRRSLSTRRPLQMAPCSSSACVGGVGGFGSLRHVSDPGRAQRPLAPARAHTLTSSPQQTNATLRFALDCSFSLTDVRDVYGVLKQVRQCVGVSRRYDADLHVFGWSERHERLSDELFGDAWKRWDCALHRRPLDTSDAEPAGVLHDDNDNDDNDDEEEEEEECSSSLLLPIVMSPDAPQSLAPADDTNITATSFVLGGLSENSGLRPRATLSRAKELGWPARRLPLDEHLPACRTKILTINATMEAVALRALGLPWQDALMTAVPRRHYVQKK